MQNDCITQHWHYMERDNIVWQKKKGEGFKKHPKNTGKLQDSLFPKATPHCYRLSV